MATNYLKELRARDGIVDYTYDSYAKENCIRTGSPYFDWVFANKSMAMPKNSGMLLASEPKCGKSLTIYAAVLQQQREDAHLPKDKRRIQYIWNTELRGQLQHTVFADLDREQMVIQDTNSAKEIFDFAEGDLKAMVQDGMPLGLLSIDSLTNIEGIKRGDAESIENHLIGDHALTVSIGLGKLIPFCKRNRIPLICTTQMRANVNKKTKFDADLKMAESWAALHGFEYFISFKKAGSAEDKVDMEGKTFSDEEQTDARGNALSTGHKIYVKCDANSIGAAGRSGVFTLDTEKGIINQHEEVFWLGKNTGVLKTESNNRVYVFGDKKWVGKKECALAIRDDAGLAAAILEEVRKLDERSV
jgi:hypothetical protein